MLSVDHVHCKKKGTSLVLVPLGTRRDVATELVDELLAHAARVRLQTRQTLDDAWAEVAADKDNEKLLHGLQKLLLDAFEFEAEPEPEPATLRKAMFLAAVAFRDAHDGRLDADVVASDVRRNLGLDFDPRDKLYADLKQEQRLVSLGVCENPAGVQALLDAYDLRQVQAVLTTAVRAEFVFSAPSPAVIRQALRTLRFLRLMATAHKRGEDLILTVEGPHTLFSATHKYGQDFAALAMSLARLGGYAVNADVRWGKRETPLQLAATVGQQGRFSESGLHNDAEALLQKLRAKGVDASPGETPLLLGKLGLWMPDIVITRDGQRCLLEVMGYHNRAGLFARLDEAHRSKEKLIFCASERLRVKESIADDVEHAHLIVYKTAISADEVLRCVENLTRRR